MPATSAITPPPLNPDTPPVLPPFVQAAIPPRMPEAQKAQAKQSSSKVIVIITLVIFVIATIFGWLLYGLKAGQLDVANANLTANATSIAAFNATATVSADQMADLESSVTKLEKQNDTLSSSLADARSSLSTSEGKVDRLNNMVSCDFTIPNKFDFTSNETVSKSLKTLIGEKDTTVEDARWTVMGDGPRNAMHFLTTNRYTYIFIVYFADDSNTSTDNIFFVSGQCFLDIGN